MFPFTAILTTTGEEKTVQAGTFQQAMTQALQIWTGEKAKDIKVYPCVSMQEEQDTSYYLAVQIAKTTIRFINGKAPNKTQQSILDDLDRLTGKYNHSPQAQDSPLACTSFLTGAGNMQTATVKDRQTGEDKDIIVAPAQIGQNTQDFISWALLGVRTGAVLIATGEGDLLGAVNMGFAELNSYIDSQRTFNLHETLTAYDLDTDTDGEEVYTPVKTDIRRILQGLTDREEEQGKTARDTALAHAMQEVSQSLSPRQKEVWALLGQGKPIGENNRTGGKIGQHRGIYGVCKALHLDKKTVKEHIKAIEKKCLQNETVCMSAYMKGYRLDSTGRTAPLPHEQEKPCIVAPAVGFTDSRKQVVYGKSLFCGDSLFYYSPHALHERRQAMYDRLFNAQGKAPVIVQEKPCIVAPVHTVDFLPHIGQGKDRKEGIYTNGVVYLLTPHEQYRQERQAMYDRLFKVHVIKPLSHEQYRQERQAMYDRLFNAQGESRTEKAPMPCPLSLPKYSYRTYRQSLYNSLWGNPYKVPTAWTAGQPIANYKYTGTAK